MSSRNVRLHGGPLHGKIMAVPEGVKYIDVQGVKEEPVNFDGSAVPQVVPTRTGQYSRVIGKPEDYEWDGWKSNV